MQQRRRIGAYGVCQDGDRLLLVRGSTRSNRPGTWFLPGGGVEQGEHPADAVVREVAEETGLVVAVRGIRAVAAEVVVAPPYLEQTDGVVYDLAVTGGTLRPEAAGTTDHAEWVDPDQLATDLPLSRFAAQALGRPAPAGPAARTRRRRRWLPLRTGPQRRGQGQRFAVYGLVTDPGGRVLLTLIADGYPGAGRWHLPGGGTDFGEQPLAALRREITEESGQVGKAGKLLAVTHHHNRSAVGPEGRPIDWHVVRAVFQVTVAGPTVPRVREQGGSTAHAAWFTGEEIAALPLTELAADLLSGADRPGWDSHGQ